MKTKNLNSKYSPDNKVKEKKRNTLTSRNKQEEDLKSNLNLVKTNNTTEELDYFNEENYPNDKETRVSILNYNKTSTLFSGSKHLNNQLTHNNQKIDNLNSIYLNSIKAKTKKQKESENEIKDAYTTGKLRVKREATYNVTSNSLFKAKYIYVNNKNDSKRKQNNNVLSSFNLKTLPTIISSNNNSNVNMNNNNTPSHRKSVLFNDSGFVTQLTQKMSHKNSTTSSFRLNSNSNLIKTKDKDLEITKKNSSIIKLDDSFRDAPKNYEKATTSQILKKRRASAFNPINKLAFNKFNIGSNGFDTEKALEIVHEDAEKKLNILKNRRENALKKKTVRRGAIKFKVYGNYFKILQRLVLNSIAKLNSNSAIDRNELSYSDQLIMEIAKPTARHILENKLYEKGVNVEPKDVLKMTFLLKNIGGFKKFMSYNQVDDESVRTSCNYITHMKVKDGDFIFHQGNKSNTFFGIIKGQVDLIKVDKKQIDIDYSRLNDHNYLMSIFPSYENDHVKFHAINNFHSFDEVEITQSNSGDGTKRDNEDSNVLTSFKETNNIPSIGGANNANSNINFNLNLNGKIKNVSNFDNHQSLPSVSFRSTVSNFNSSNKKIPEIHVNTIINNTHNTHNTNNIANNTAINNNIINNTSLPSNRRSSVKGSSTGNLALVKNESFVDSNTSKHLNIRRHISHHDKLYNVKEIYLTTLKEGMVFGEWGLIYNKERACCARAKGDVDLFVVDKNCFKLSFSKCLVRAETDRKLFILNVTSYFRRLGPENFDIVYKKMVALQKNKNEEIFSEGQPATSIYFVYQGECTFYKNCKLTKDKVEIKKMLTGDIFGLEATSENNLNEILKKKFIDEKNKNLSKDQQEVYNPVLSKYTSSASSTSDSTIILKLDLTFCIELCKPDFFSIMSKIHKEKEIFARKILKKKSEVRFKYKPNYIQHDLNRRANPEYKKAYLEEVASTAEVRRKSLHKKSAPQNNFKVNNQEIKPFSLRVLMESEKDHKHRSSRTSKNSRSLSNNKNFNLNNISNSSLKLKSGTKSRTRNLSKIKLNNNNDDCYEENNNSQKMNLTSKEEQSNIEITTNNLNTSYNNYTVNINTNQNINASNNKLLKKQKSKLVFFPKRFLKHFNPKDININKLNYIYTSEDKDFLIKPFKTRENMLTDNNWDNDNDIQNNQYNDEEEIKYTNQLEYSRNNYIGSSNVQRRKETSRGKIKHINVASFNDKKRNAKECVDSTNELQSTTERVNSTTTGRTMTNITKDFNSRTDCNILNNTKFNSNISVKDNFDANVIEGGVFETLTNDSVENKIDDQIKNFDYNCNNDEYQELYELNSEEIVKKPSQKNIENNITVREFKEFTSKLEVSKIENTQILQNCAIVEASRKNTIEINKISAKNINNLSKTKKNDSNNNNYNNKVNYIKQSVVKEKENSIIKNKKNLQSLVSQVYSLPNTTTKSNSNNINGNNNLNKIPKNFKTENFDIPLVTDLLQFNYK